MNDFQKFLIENRTASTISIVYDIETLQYNEEVGYKNPSLFKNVTYSVAIGFYYNMKLCIKVYPSFKGFFNEIVNTYKKWKKTPKIELIAHNCNKYDNHFLRHDLMYFYKLRVQNIFLKNATEEGNILTTKKNQLEYIDKQGTILEKRIKSSNNLELVFFLNGIEFFTTDNYMKTNTSIKTLGEKMLKMLLITEDDLKTDYNYTKFNRDYDMSDNEAYKYAEEVFKNLDEEEMTYIHNDIIILAESINNYSTLFQGFDYSKITFTSNILEYYNDNDLTSFQLLKSVGKGKDKTHIKYTSYNFGGENFYDYLKSFYAGGLNFYNDKLVGKIIYEKLIAMDINSSYPYAMHNFKVPTFVHEYKDFEERQKIKIKDDDYFYLYRMDKQDFDREIIGKIKSRVLRQMIVKYYTKNDYVNINSYTIKMIQDICKIKIEKLTVHNYVSFECIYFGSRDKISEKYYIKTQGSSKYEIEYKSPYEIYETVRKNNTPFTDGEIDIAKVILNGLYGIPALRSHFNLFRWVAGDLQNVPNGYENNERNIVFSVFVTAVSLYNLLLPLASLTQDEIDENFVYCDTDSLYLNKKIQHKISADLFHPTHLGKWGYDSEQIDKFIVINHKKYAYEHYCKKKKKVRIIVKAGGIPQKAFDTNMSFEKFVETQFTDGVNIKNTKSIFNKQGTISIYDSHTKLQTGNGYRLFAHDELIESMKKQMLEDIKLNGDGSVPDMLYIESNIGTFSMSDLYPHKNETSKKQTLLHLKNFEKVIRNNYLHSI